ncbi:MAG: hypothetical protein LBR91_00030 [Puniceicoccales bacterium]|nr:hypothetical protein [Puniceicoccales bacterium]
MGTKRNSGVTMLELSVCVVALAMLMGSFTLLNKGDAANAVDDAVKLAKAKANIIRVISWCRRKSIESRGEVWLKWVFSNDGMSFLTVYDRL